MSIFKIISHSKEDELMLLERINYIFDPLATERRLISGKNISIMYPYEEIILVKKCYLSTKNNTIQGRQFFEFIISLQEEESFYLEDFYYCIDNIISWFADSMNGHYQVISAIHTNTENLHAHIIMNNTDFCTGKRLDISMKLFYLIREIISSILKKYGFSCIVKVS